MRWDFGEMKGLTLLAFIGVTSAAFATPTSLITVPIADILQHRELALNYAVTGAGSNPQYAHFGGTTVGLFNRVEVGTGHDFNGFNSWSAKVQLCDCEQGALSAGIMNCHGKDVDPYVVGRLDFETFRIHAGWERLSNVHFGFVGVDYGLNDAITLMLEHTGGPDGYTWTAANWVFAENWALMGAYGKPNRVSNGEQHMVALTYGTRF